MVNEVVVELGVDGGNGGDRTSGLGDGIVVDDADGFGSS